MAASAAACTVEQLATMRSGIPDFDTAKGHGALTDAQLAYKSSEQIGNKLLYRFSSPDEQLQAAEESEGPDSKGRPRRGARRRRREQSTMITRRILGAHGRADPFGGAADIHCHFSMFAFPTDLP